MRTACLAVACLVACGSGSGSGDESDEPVSAPTDPPAAAVTSPAETPGPARACRRDDRFARSVPLAEASGAAYVPARGGAPAHLLVVGDSGTGGAFVELDPDTGDVRASGQLPLDEEASDDLEGLSFAGGVVHGITSSGWMRHWRRTAAGTYELSAPAYPLAERTGQGVQLVCATGHDGNCERNYEGLCLTAAADGCVGFAVAKADGRLYCLVRAGERLRIDAGRVIDVGEPHVLTGCHFDDDGALWVGSNTFAVGAVHRITGWQTPAEAAIEDVTATGSGFPEAIAVAPGGAVYRFSDMATAPSLADRYRCGPAD